MASCSWVSPRVPVVAVGRVLLPVNRLARFGLVLGAAAAAVAGGAARDVAVDAAGGRGADGVAAVVLVGRALTVVRRTQPS